MRMLVSITLAVALIAGFTARSNAQHSDFLGTWSGDTTILLQSGDDIVEVPRNMNVVIETVSGNLVRGYRHWQAITDDPGNVAGVDVLSASEPFIGAIDADGVTARLVEIEDNGMIILELLAPDRLEVTYLETAPHAVAFSAVLSRQAN